MTTARASRAAVLAMVWAASPSSASPLGLLTPSSTRDVQVTMDADFTTGMPMADVVRPSVDRQRTQRLTALATAAAFDPGTRFERSLRAALAAQGTSVDPVPITRARAGARPVARDELPYPPTHAAYVDVTIDNVWLVAKTHTSPYRPALRVTYRVVDAKGNLVQPARSHVLNRFRSVLANDASAAGAGFRHATRVEAPDDPACEFETFDAAARETARLWACFDGALDTVAAAIAREFASPAAPPGP